MARIEGPRPNEFRRPTPEEIQAGLQEGWNTWTKLRKDRIGKLPKVTTAFINPL
jgi:hypothetical protein